MGKRGPAKEPTALRLLKGNPGKRAINAAEPQPPAVPADLQPPEWVQSDERALAEWQRVFPHLQTLGLVTVVDVTALAALCRQYSLWRACEDFLRSEGRVIELRDDKGNLKGVIAAPHVKMADAAYDRWARMCREFGLTPSARTGLKVEKPKASALAAFRKGAG